MTRTKQIVLTILTVSQLTGCDFITNSFSHKDKTKDLVETLLQEDYDKAIDHFAMEHEMAKNTDKDAMKKGLTGFREIVVKNFGTELNYSLMYSKKTFTIDDEENTQPNTTVTMIEFSNDKEFGVFKVIFDDNSGKILSINTLDVKQPIPSMTFFWFFGLLVICVPIFNIYVIRQIKRSGLEMNWLKYLSVILFNVPAITYAAVNGFSYNLFSFQIMLGISFGYMGYLSSYWTFGLPLGGLYWFWKLRQHKKAIAEAELTTDHYIEIDPTTDNEKPTT
jgi:hypothetical protein